MSSHPRLALAIAALAGLIIAALVVLALTSALGRGERASLDRAQPALTAGATTDPELAHSREGRPMPSEESPRRKPRDRGDDGSARIGGQQVIRPQDGHPTPAPSGGPGIGGQAEPQPQQRERRAAPLGQQRSGVGKRNETYKGSVPEPELSPAPTPRRAPNPVAALQPITVPEPEPTPTATPEADPAPPASAVDGDGSDDN